MLKTDEYYTVDSEKVSIVYDLRAHEGKFGIESTLVEVDHDAMVSLIVNYRQIIVRNGPQMSNAATKEVLDTMIEDARKLAQRSPILFRTSFRSVISRARDIRYGVNLPQTFRTIITSKGIREIIGWSGSYYKSLDDAQQMKQMSEEQKEIKSKFLQMMVVLLSLLNDEHLKELQSYVESTFRLKADRKSFEMLCLKVIPLMSINPKLFMMELLRAFEGYRPHEPEESELGSYWDEFLKRRIGDGCILPAPFEFLGRSTLSWIPKWPQDEISSSIIFRNLQYVSDLQAINEISQIDLRPQDDNSPLTVLLVNGDTYLIDPTDYEKIVHLHFGRFPLKNPLSGGSDEGNFRELFIDEFWLNESTRKACDALNEITRQVNAYFEKREARGKLIRYATFRSGGSHQPQRPYRLAAGKITKHVARVGNDTLAAAFKEKGYNVTKWDVMTHIKEDNNHMLDIVKRYRRHLKEDSLNLPPADITTMKNSLDTVQKMLDISDKVYPTVWNEDPMSNDPIVKALRGEGNDRVLSPIWQSYKPKLIGPDWPYPKFGHVNTDYRCLELTARRCQVQTVKWGDDNSLAEVTLSDTGTTYVVAPLSPVEEQCRDDYLRVGDVAILLGYYLVIAEKAEDRPSEDLLYMMNCFSIMSTVEEPVTTRRGHNRQEKSKRGANRGQSEGTTLCRFG